MIVKKIKLYLTLVFISGILVVFVACDHSILDKSPLDQPTDESVWNSVSLGEAFLARMYRDLGHGLKQMNTGVFTDEGHYIHGHGSHTITDAILSPTDMSGWHAGNFVPQYRWASIYSSLRRANSFLENIDDAEVASEERRDQMIGEAHFIRAKLFHFLARQWGGAPIILRTYELDDEFEVERSTYEEMVNQVLADAGVAAEKLDWIAHEEGRASRGAALALQNRMLTYAASDLYHNTGSWAGGYENPELVGYVGGDQQALWRQAKNIAAEIINEGPYALYDVDPDPTKNYHDIWQLGGGDEAIFKKMIDRESPPSGYEPGMHQISNGYFGWASSSPTQNLVDDYERIDGEEFDWSNPDHAADPFADRDPRLAATILYDGLEYIERPEASRAMDPRGIIQGYRWIRELDDDGNVISRTGGLDTRNGAIQDWNGSFTTYYLHKYVDPESQFWFRNNQSVDWIHIRYAEILLNYAEASIELGEEADALWAINKIRNRAGMPDINDSGQDLVDRYRNERRVEFAFEDQRFFDVRRWMIAHETDAADAYGIYLEAEYTRDTSKEMNGMYEYEWVLSDDIPDQVERTPGNNNIGLIRVQQRFWNDSHYKLPIEASEMNRNPLLIQNPLY